MTMINTYPFDEYICGVTGLTCCGCSLFCEHRKEKMLIEKIKRIREQYGYPIWLIKKALEYYDGDEDEAIKKLTEIYRAIGDHPDVVIERNIEKFMDEIRYSKANIKQRRHNENNCRITTRLSV